MSEPAPIHERHLRRLADMDVRADVIARGLEERIAAAETAAEVRDLALAYQRITRGIRQIIALEAKLDHEQRQAVRQAHVDAERAAQARLQHRRAHVQTAVERLIWNEAEGSEAERLERVLDDLLELEVFAPDFTDAAIETVITRLAEELELSAPVAAATAPISAETAGGRPPAERSEERVAEGASLRLGDHDP